MQITGGKFDFSVRRMVLCRLFLRRNFRQSVATKTAEIYVPRKNKVLFKLDVRIYRQNVIGVVTSVAKY